MPYALIDRNIFVRDATQQLKMNSNPYVFPYTLQYVGTIPYLYHLKNIFFWGAGPFISLLALFGALSLIKKTGKAYLFLLVTYGFYFLVVGQSAVKFMRYMLVLYPFIAVLAGYGLHYLKKSNFFLAAVFLSGSVFWSASFVSIYLQTHTQVVASNWIRKNIPSGSTIAVEHWDNRLPITDSQIYRFEELPLYDLPDNQDKWTKINNQLDRSDYIVIASNRLYSPLTTLSDCKEYKVCYPKTNAYYRSLFAGNMPFVKIAEFKNLPGLSVGSWGFSINDQAADESFTVYDHPKVMIFKKLH